MKIINPIKPFVFYKKAIICETEEEAKLLLEIASLKGYKWKSGEPFKHHNNWNNSDKFGLTYYIDLGQYGSVCLIDKLRYEIVYFKNIKEQLKRIGNYGNR